MNRNDRTGEQMAIVIPFPGVIVSAKTSAAGATPADNEPESTEKQARRAVQLADERNAILRDLGILTDPERNLGEGQGLVIVTKDWPPIGAMIDGVIPPHEELIPVATKLTAAIPREVFNQVLGAMVSSSRQRIRVIEDEMRALGVEP